MQPFSAITHGAFDLMASVSLAHQGEKAVSEDEDGQVHSKHKSETHADEVDHDCDSHVWPRQSQATER